MEVSNEYMTFKKSCLLFKRGVDPDNLVPNLYSKGLLTREEKGKVSQRALTDDEKTDALFTILERRVSTEAKNFHTIVNILQDEPALKHVGDKMKGIIQCILQSEKEGCMDVNKRKQYWHSRGRQKCLLCACL